MAKSVIGTMRHKKLIEGDENLLEENEVLIKEDSVFTYILKERNEQGELTTSIVMPLDLYIAHLAEAFEEGARDNES